MPSTRDLLRLFTHWWDLRVLLAADRARNAEVICGCWIYAWLWDLLHSWANLCNPGRASDPTADRARDSLLPGSPGGGATSAAGMRQGLNGIAQGFNGIVTISA